MTNEGWIDTNGCPETFHALKRKDGRLIAEHSDGSECEEAEFRFEEAA